jgi:hypothetical protein
MWTEGDEKVFQELLERRRAASAKTFEELRPTDEEIHMISDGLSEHYDSSLPLENFLNWADPDEVRETVGSLRS